MLALICHCPTVADQINAHLDAAIQSARANQPEREYLGASRLGMSCARALQYEYTKTPKDAEFKGQTLRIFEIGHAFEALVLAWLRQAGFTVRSRKNLMASRLRGFSVAGGCIRGHVGRHYQCRARRYWHGISRHLGMQITQCQNPGATRSRTA